MSLSLSFPPAIAAFLPHALHPLVLFCYPFPSISAQLLSSIRPNRRSHVVDPLPPPEDANLDIFAHTFSDIRTVVFVLIFLIVLLGGRIIFHKLRLNNYVPDSVVVISAGLNRVAEKETLLGNAWLAVPCIVRRGAPCASLYPQILPQSSVAFQASWLVPSSYSACLLLFPLCLIPTHMHTDRHVFLHLFCFLFFLTKYNPLSHTSAHCRRSMLIPHWRLWSIVSPPFFLTLHKLLHPADSSST